MAIGPALVNPPSKMISRALAMNVIIPGYGELGFVYQLVGVRQQMTCIDVPPGRIGY